MKLEYKILWLDDKIEEFKEDEIISEVEQFITDNGFQPQIITHYDTQEFLDSVNNDFDLILTDYNLNDTSGNEVIKTIRGSDHAITSEILFYTAQADLGPMERIDRVSFLSTSGNNHRELVIKRVKELITLTIKKFQNIVAMRGLIMHETSALDYQVEELVKNQLTNPDLKDKIKDIESNILESIQQNAAEKYNKAKSGKLNRILKDNILFNTSQKIFALGQILDLREESNFTDAYKTEIINIRNKFAHSKLEVRQDGTKVFKTNPEDIIFDDAYCKEIRQNIRKHKNFLDTIEKKWKAIPTATVPE